MRKMVFFCMVMIIFLTQIVAACSIGKNEAKVSPPKETKQKEEIILSIGGEPDTGFDPTTGWGQYGSPLFQSTILKRDSKMNVVNDLATAYEISEDGLVWTVHLREDVLFSDGKLLTSADVQFTFERAATSGSIIDLTNMSSVEAIDPTTVIFTLKEPQSTFITTLVSTGIVPKHAYDANYKTNPIGSGPYQLIQWDKGQQLIVEFNPYYYGEKPFFKKLTFLFLNEDASFAAAKTGEVDISAIPSSFSKQGVKGMKFIAVKTADNRGIMFPYMKSGEFTEEGYPIGNDVTADIAIRKAINLAIDRDFLVDTLLEGYGSPAYSLNDGFPWWNKETVFEDGNIQLAQQTLDEAGWTIQSGEGIRQKEGINAEFTLIYPSSDQTRQSLALAVADLLKPLGIKINVEGKNWDEIVTRMHADAVMMGFGSHDPIEIYNVYSTRFQGVDFYNPGYYSNSVVDEWMDKALRATNEKQAHEYWQKAQWDGETGLSGIGDAPWAWLVNIDHLYFAKEDLDIGEQQIHPHGHGWPVTANIEQWKWSK